MNQISERIQKLEKRLGWWQLISFAAFTCLTIFVSLHFAKISNLPQIDNVISTAKGQFTELSIIDKKGRQRAILAVSRTGPILSLMNEDSTTGCMLSLDEKAGASLVFTKGNKTRLSITSIPPAVICADSNGAPKAIVAVSQKGDGVFSLTRSDGTPVIYQTRDLPSIQHLPSQ